MIITIDGPAGTGKTTVARKVAEKLNQPYFDTGAMYRAVAALMLREPISLTDEKKIRELLTRFTFEIQISDEEPHYFASGLDVTQVIRSPEVTAIVSAVSALPIVRETLWRIQQRFAKKKGGVFEGRDMGSVVFPNAQFKIFLNACPEIRAARRFAEQQGVATQEEMENELAKRDLLDSTRALAPLQCPPDAYVIDTSELSLEEVVDQIIEYCHKKNTKSAWMHLRGVPFLYRCVLFFTWIVCKLCYRLKIYGLEHFYPRGAIIAANHTSFLDPPIVSISWPEVVHFLARGSLFKNKLFGWFIRSINTHPVSGDVGNLHVMKTVLSLLEEGKKVVLFPEGTRSETGELQPIKPGIGFLVSRSKTAVIPVYIHGTYEVWGKKRKFPRPFGKISIVFGSVITWASIEAIDSKEGSQLLSKKLEAAWGRAEGLAGNGGKGLPP